jgi:transcriptional regulator with XRE-family HTH domain
LSGSSSIKDLRMKAGLSQNKLARLADLDRTTVSNAENGASVSELSLSKLSAALSSKLGREVSLDHLLGKTNYSRKLGK